MSALIVRQLEVHRLVGNERKKRKVDGGNEGGKEEWRGGNEGGKEEWRGGNEWILVLGLGRSESGMSGWEPATSAGPAVERNSFRPCLTCCIRCEVGNCLFSFFSAAICAFVQW
jgi:hypothetical protein